MSETPIDIDDLESEWSELRGGGRASWFFGTDADDDRPSLWFFPVMLLYTGFFFGPFVTALMAAVTVRGRIEMRHAAIAVGACGTAWCLLQGLSIYNGAWWSELELQTMRSALNFAAGIVTYIVIRPPAVARFRQSRVTMAISLAVIVLGIVVFLFAPSDILIALGR